jgi:hypothetical protein
MAAVLLLQVAAVVVEQEPLAQMVAMVLLVLVEMV